MRRVAGFQQHLPKLNSQLALWIQQGLIKQTKLLFKLNSEIKVHSTRVSFLLIPLYPSLAAQFELAIAEFDQVFRFIVPRRCSFHFT